MKLFTQVALVSAIAISGNAMAMQALDDSALSSSTGQEGITVKINSPGITIDKLLVHDNDGLSATATMGAQNLGGTGNAGAIIVNGISIAPQVVGGPLVQLDIDADGGAASGDAFLNIGVKLAATNIGVGSITVGTSNALPLVGARRGATGENAVLSNINLAMGATDLNIQLGNQPQGALIRANGTVTGGISLTGVTLTDADGLAAAGGNAGDIVLDSIKLTNANSNDLSGDIAINVDSAVGLAITLSNANYDAYVGGVHLGSAGAASIGDIEVQGLNLGGTTLLVSGH